MTMFACSVLLHPKPRSTMFWLATALTLPALVLGSMVGLIGGRWGWQQIAQAPLTGPHVCTSGDRPRDHRRNHHRQPRRVAAGAASDDRQTRSSPARNSENRPITRDHVNRTSLSHVLLNRRVAGSDNCVRCSCLPATSMTHRHDRSRANADVAKEEMAPWQRHRRRVLVIGVFVVYVTLIKLGRPPPLGLTSCADNHGTCFRRGQRHSRQPAAASSSNASPPTSTATGRSPTRHRSATASPRISSAASPTTWRSDAPTPSPARSPSPARRSRQRKRLLISPS